MKDKENEITHIFAAPHAVLLVSEEVSKVAAGVVQSFLVIKAVCGAAEPTVVLQAQLKTTLNVGHLTVRTGRGLDGDLDKSGESSATVVDACAERSVSGAVGVGSATCRKLGVQK